MSDFLSLLNKKLCRLLHLILTSLRRVACHELYNLGRLFSSGPLTDQKSPITKESSPSSRSRNLPFSSTSEFAGEETLAPDPHWPSKSPLTVNPLVQVDVPSNGEIEPPLEINSSEKPLLVDDSPVILPVVISEEVPINSDIPIQLLLPGKVVFSAPCNTAPSRLGAWTRPFIFEYIVELSYA